jgi:hypothetical protein
MGRLLGLALALALLGVAVLGGGGAVAASGPNCKPGSKLDKDPLDDVPNRPEETVHPIVIGCWSFDGQKTQVHGRRMKVKGEDELCLGTQMKVVCLDPWPPPKNRHIAGTSCGGGGGHVFVEGTVSKRVRRVDVRYRDAGGVKRSRRASLVWLRGEVAEKLRTRTFGYYRGLTAKGAQVIEVLARDSDGRVLGRAKQTGCNEPR